MTVGDIAGGADDAGLDRIGGRIHRYDATCGDVDRHAAGATGRNADGQTKGKNIRIGQGIDGHSFAGCL